MTDAVPEPDDRSLVAAHLAGDPEAFGILFTRHRDRLWAVALRTMGNCHWAELAESRTGWQLSTWNAHA